MAEGTEKQETIDMIFEELLALYEQEANNGIANRAGSSDERYELEDQVQNRISQFRIRWRFAR